MTVRVNIMLIKNGPNASWQCKLTNFRFLGYYQQVLSLGVSYVPYMHSNQSTIEALFLYVRGANRDSVTSYRAAVRINSLVNSKKALNKNNKYYSTDDMAEE
jgi:hypothetical protein